MGRQADFFVVFFYEVALTRDWYPAILLLNNWLTAKEKHVCVLIVAGFINWIGNLWKEKKEKKEREKCTQLDLFQYNL